MTTVVAASLREFVRTRTITFSEDRPLKPEVAAELLQLSEEARQGIAVSPAFTSLAEARAWLEAHREDD